MEYRVHHEDTVCYPDDDAGGCTTVCEEERQAGQDHFEGTTLWGVWEEEGVTSS